jgi:hypothetical protein
VKSSNINVSDLVAVLAIAVGQFEGDFHGCQHMLTTLRRQHMLTTRSKPAKNRSIRTRDLMVTPEARL